MKKSTTLIASLSIMAAMSLGASAQAHGLRHSDYYQRNTRVTRVETVRHTRVVHSAPREVCRTESSGRTYGSASAGGTLVGAVLGGVVGNQIGHGRPGATAIGVIAGAAIGHDIGSQAYGGRREVAYRQVCRTVPGQARVTHTSRYQVTHRYVSHGGDMHSYWDMGRH